MSMASRASSTTRPTSATSPSSASTAAVSSSKKHHPPAPSRETSTYGDHRPPLGRHTMGQRHRPPLGRHTMGYRPRSADPLTPALHDTAPHSATRRGGGPFVVPTTPQAALPR